MSRLSNLLQQVETQDPHLAADLKREVEALSGRRAFGLNFERHIPKTVELPHRPVRRGDKVRFLPERGEKPSSVHRRLWRVGRIRRTDEGRVADLVRDQAPELGEIEKHSTLARPRQEPEDFSCRRREIMIDAEHTRARGCRKCRHRGNPLQSQRVTTAAWKPSASTLPATPTADLLTNH